MRKTIAVSLALVALLAFGAVTVFAQGPRGGNDTMPFAGGRGVGTASVDDIADALGVDADDLLEALQDGQTVADIAAEQGVALEDLIATLVADAAEDLAASVADGDLTQAQADAQIALLEANLEARFTTEMFSNRPDRTGIMPMIGGARGITGDYLETVAETLGLESDALLEALQDGQSVADIAEEQGVALEDVTAAIVANAAETLAESVADEDITQEEADAYLVLLESHIETMLDNAHPMAGFAGEYMDGGRGGMMSQQFGGRGQMPQGGMRGGFTGGRGN